MNNIGSSLGSVDVDVGANLEKMLRGFREAELAADRFDKALERRVSMTTKNAERAADALGRAEVRLGRSLDQTSSAASRYNSQIEKVGNESVVAAKKADSAFAQVRRSLLGSATILVGAFGLNQLKNTMDGYTRFTNQLKVAGVEGERLNGTQQNLFATAQKYGVELESLGTLHGRLLQSQRELNATSGQMIQFTNGVAAAVKIQGATTEQSRGALMQLTQALGGEIVRAEEFNSINEGARPILQAVANGIDRYGGSIAKLRREVVNGNVTSKEFFAGFLRGSGQLEEQAKSANLTIGASFTTLNNALGMYIGKTDEAYSVTERISMGIAALANNLDVIMPVLTAVVVAIGARYVSALGAATVATLRKAAADAALALAENALAASTGRVTTTLGVQAGAQTAAALASTRYAGTLGAVTVSSNIMAASVARTGTAMAVASGMAATLGRGLLAAFGGPVGLAITAVAGAVYLYAQRQQEAAAEIVRFKANGVELNQTLKETGVYGRGAADGVKGLGSSASSAAPGIKAFAGATGEAADQLYRLADARRKEAIERLRAAETAAREDASAASTRYQEQGQSSGSVSRFGYLPLSKSQIAERDKETKRYEEAKRREGQARTERERLESLGLESFVPLARTGGRDIGAEISQLQAQLVAANKAKNETAQREILKQLKQLRKINELLSQGLSMDVATATAQAEALGAKQSSSASSGAKEQISFGMPVAGRPTSDYGPRVAPVDPRTGKRGSSFHPAQDFGVPIGTSVKAPAGGVVIRTGRNGGFGNVVWIDHGNGTISELNHLSSATRAVGDTVQKGEQVALSGNTGVSTGPHLDWRVRVGAGKGGKGGRYVDPMKAKVEGSMGDAAQNAQDAAREEERKAQQFAQERMRADDQLLQARLDQAKGAEELAKLEAQRVNLARDREKQDIEQKLKSGEYTQIQADQLSKANEALRTLEIRGVDLKKQEQLENDAKRITEATGERLIEILDVERDIARTASERRSIERRILDARKELERQALEATINSPFSSDTDKQIARADLGSIDSRYGKQKDQLNSGLRSDLLGTAVPGSEIDTAQQIEDLQSQEAEKLLIIQEALEQRLITEADAAQRRIDIERDTAAKIGEIETARKSMILSSAQNVAESMMQITETLAGKQSAAYKAMFIASKAFAIADATIKIQTAIANALAIPFPANIPAIVQAAALGASIVSNIAAIGGQFDTGGWTGDMPRNAVAGAVHGQEFVIKAGPARKHRQVLESINSGRDPAAAIQASAASRGGLASGVMGRPLNVKLQNYATGVRHEVKQGLTRDEVIIIAREEAPKAVAADLGRPNSKTRKAVERNTTARGRKV